MGPRESKQTGAASRRRLGNGSRLQLPSGQTANEDFGDRQARHRYRQLRPRRRPRRKRLRQRQYRRQLRNRRRKSATARITRFPFPLSFFRVDGARFRRRRAITRRRITTYKSRRDTRCPRASLRSKTLLEVCIRSWNVSALPPTALFSLFAEPLSSRKQ